MDCLIIEFLTYDILNAFDVVLFWRELNNDVGFLMSIQLLSLLFSWPIICVLFDIHIYIDKYRCAISKWEGIVTISMYLH